MHFLGKCFKNELIYGFSTGFKNKTYILNYIRLSYVNTYDPCTRYHVTPCLKMKNLSVTSSILISTVPL